MSVILIVDDEIENRKALKRAIGDENPDWVIHLAKGEQDAEKFLEKQVAEGHPVDVLLTDLVMDTEKSGMNLLVKARRIDPLIMAILFTAKEKSLDRYAAFDFGAFDVVEKNIRGASAVREIITKTRAAIKYREWSQRVNYLRRYFDPKIFETIERDPSLLALSRKTVTIAFWDVRGFSKLCESLKAHPTLISGFLRDYCEIGANTIFRNNGLLDKFIGDGIMALFGVLSKNDDDGKGEAKNAILSAIQMLQEFEAIKKKWMEQWTLYVPDEIEIGLGCGIHTGEVLVGNVGTDFRDQFTALGPHVNFASRIEARAAIGQILVSQSTFSRIKSDFKSSEISKLNDIKNIPGTFKIYEVIEK